jgi:hypothetical protein
MRLAGGTDFLVLRRDESFLGHTVAFYDTFPEALATWTPGARISPVFALDNATPPSLRDGAACWLLFAGPLHPERLDFGRSRGTFLTLGLFNVLLVSTTEEEAEIARQRIGLIGRCWEEWTLCGDRLVDRRYSERIAAQEPIPRALRQVVKPSEELLNEALREYSTMMATSVGRAAWFLPEAVDDLLQFDALFRTAYSSGRGDAVLKQGMVVQVNAALSRFSSQTFSGTSPITETECHFWTHSLLGIGSASLALLSVRAHLLRVFGDSRLIANVLALKQLPPEPNDLAALPASDAFWQEPHLERARPLIPAPTSTDTEIPQIMFYSGRDGFHSTPWSLSGPLELITSCNTTAWTMLTLTHEFAHFIVERLLGQLLPNPNSEADLVRTATVIKTSAPADLFEQLRAYLCFAMWTLTDNITAQEPTPALLAQAITSQHGELDEILTSLTDFLYFYQGKEDSTSVHCGLAGASSQTSRTVSRSTLFDASACYT